MENKEFLGRTVKAVLSICQIEKDEKYLVIGITNESLCLYSKNIVRGHNGSNRGINFIDDYKYESSRGENCWLVGKEDIELIEDFKHVFNKLMEEENDNENIK